MRKQFLCGAIAVLNVINIVAMELPQKTSSYKGLSLKETAIKRVLENGNNHPCDHIDTLLANEDLCEDLCNDLKNGFYEKYKGCLSERKLYDQSSVNKSMISADGSRVYILQMGGLSTIKELDMQSGSPLRMIENCVSIQRDDSINDFFYNSVNNKEILIAGFGNGTIKLWDLKESKSCAKLLDNKAHVQALAANNTNLFCGISFKKINIWDIESGTCCMQAGIYNDKVYDKACMLKNSMLYVVTGDNVVGCDVRSGNCSVVLTSDEISAIADSSLYPFTLFSGSGYSEIKEWDMRNTSEPVCVIETGHSVNSITTKDQTLYAALAPLLGFGDGRGNKPSHSGIRVFDIQGDNKGLSFIKSLPGKGCICDVQANNEGLCVAGTSGLTFLPTQSYENMYNILKKATVQKALEYSKK